ncbi:PREDICTED: LOW QUALITY PROTEIN: Hermansky-Pudlak syndrome 6 protein [Charadrius vociferus]|uniref:LOW QUALITY PROTEIN: Hermansky-Pudlak syndrome 6 protein n=1 Tax=Charadrius vociferus TaxID=50402 RepID=UPI00052122B9|nr:PREDICTED: LOW QUALITY PROTEIN: Hermansky-Pudlak syndrome 6 protein [Charadrius vociferus]
MLYTLKVVAFQRHGISGADLERNWQQPQTALVGLLFLQSPVTLGSSALALVWEHGRTEVWHFVVAVGWQLLQTLELCQGARARIVSVCSQGASLVWCEERPPLDAHSDMSKCAFRFCVCTRALEVGEQGVRLGTLRIVLHNSPEYQVLASPQHIFLVPATASFATTSKFLLIWHPEKAKLTITAPSAGFVHRKVLRSSNESDFRKLLLGSVGLLSCLAPLDIHTSAVSNSGGLLLVSTKGAVNMLEPDGTQRHIFDLEAGALAQGSPVQLKTFGSILACVLAGVLYLIDQNSGRLIEKKILSMKEVHFLESPGEEDSIQLLTQTGIYSFSFSKPEDSSRPEPCLVEMVFEEACRYYQRRSLSSSKLTVEKLKKGGVFQAPVALAAILQHSLCQKQKPARGLQDTYAKLLSTMSLELQSYMSLELLKTCVVCAPESEVESCCEELVEQEVSRVLHSDMDKDNLAYLNSIFASFPKAAWKATRSCLQLQQNGDGLLVARATPEVWKKVLGGPQQEEVGQNGAVPLFELICASFLRYKPKWLPSFVELTQQYVSISWAYSSKEGPEGRVPLYKRALGVLARKNKRSEADDEMELELLLCSKRPKAVLQALHLLICLKRWQRVVEVAEKFSKLSPLLNKEIFTMLLAEFAQHRELDPYLDTMVLQHLPCSQEDPVPFSSEGNQLTVGLLKPLLQRVVQRPCVQDEMYSDALQSPTFPPPPPPREHKIPSKATADNAPQPPVARTSSPSVLVQGDTV